MKTRLFFLSAVLCFTFKGVNAQITIGTADLPSANDTFRLSVANPPAGADFTLTGANYNWDFSQLVPQSQRVDTFFPVSATGNFQFLFGFSSNLATKGGNFNVGTGPVGATGTDVYNFYKNSTASYAQTGLGASFNNLPIPSIFNPKDLVYSFPLSFGDRDSCFSSYALDLSPLGIYFRGDRNRINVVDGWGTLTTPFGSRNVIRVKTTVVEVDSIHIDTFGIVFGTTLPPTTTVEYKWLAAGEGVPFLQANTGQNGTVNQIIYRDQRRSLIGVEEIDAADGLEVYPNPSSDALFISNSNSKRFSCSLSLLDVQGKVVLSRSLEMLPGETARIDYEGRLSPGQYVLHLQSGTDIRVKLITVAGSR
jgi:hypothetical protein